MDYYSGTKMNELLIHATTEPPNASSCERSQTQASTCSQLYEGQNQAIKVRLLVSLRVYGMGGDPRKSPGVLEVNLDPDAEGMYIAHKN